VVIAIENWFADLLGERARLVAQLERLSQRLLGDPMQGARYPEHLERMSGR
jgi:hypothetical protein